MKFSAIDEAKTYADTVVTFFPNLDQTTQVRMGFLSGFELAKKKYGIKDDTFEREMESQPTLFEWAGNNQNFSGRALGAETPRGSSRH